MFGEKKRFHWVAAVLGGLLLFILPGTCSSRIKGVFKDALTPVQSIVLRTTRSLKEGTDTVRGFGGLAEENRLLRQEVVKLQAEDRVRESLQEENIRLSHLLQFRNSQPHELIAARVVARTIDGWWKSVRVDKGTRDDIFADRAVISPDGLVGRTEDVSAHTAEVLLVSDPACKVSARIARTGSFGLTVGRGVTLDGYPVVRMQFIHKDVPVRKGDAVVTSGLGGVFPKDILIGHIDEVHTEEAGLYQYADIVPNAIVELLDVVFVPSGLEAE